MAQKPDIQAVWLDPHGLIPEPAARMFANLGWRITVVRMLEELGDAARAADAVVLRVARDLSILEDARGELRRAGLSCTLVCRLDSGALSLAAAVSRAGVEQIVGADDWSEASWNQIARSLGAPATPSARARPQPVFADAASRALLDMARRVGAAGVTALVLGPTGAGKEVLARLLHEASPRAEGPFRALNCAAMPEHLVEDILFGHEKGAFTGAIRDHAGLFEQAQGGTLFLDEIGEMPVLLQSKLLRVLQEREITRLGGHAPVPVDVRIVAATNRDLRRAIAERAFREDLYYRIATFQLRVSPLSSRPGDILPLAARFLAEQPCPDGAWVLTPDAQTRLLSHPWPGNIRELQNVVLRATVVCQGACIEARHLLFDAWDASPGADTAALPSPGVATASSVPRPEDTWMPVGQPVSGLPPVLPGAWPAMAASDLHSATQFHEHRVIMAALAACATRTEAARRLGISDRTLRYKLARLRDVGLMPAVTD